ncbi:glycerophosphodiester phosphodiesterase [Legionella impletisoli]|uniref:Glycerophosphoryl diester phosphodiesterase n=1 Tax=Legionella impletisoli TaxID=343510 RepID=A0A917JSH7_9GAMM|nr:glycerophosphodiester phosphodiesterase family protein [Legionella impletisoli]GGI84800.1 glycerophosphoryl diester phosphodiesterase [Legionella impletisoli]
MALLNIIERLIDSWFAFMPQPKPSSASILNTRLIAHRGAHAHHTNIIENTLPAFQRAQDLGCWGIELDVHSTKDQMFVVNHDPDLKRLWNRTMTISQCHFETLRQEVPEIPTLNEVVKRFGGQMHLFIELKSAIRNESILADILSHLTPSEDYHLISLQDRFFEHFSRFPNHSLLLVPEHNNVKRFVNLSLSKEYGGVLGHYLLLRNKYIKKLRQAQQIAGVGFIDSKYSLYREMNRDLHYIFTNQAEKMSRYLQDLQDEHK